MAVIEPTSQTPQNGNYVTWRELNLVIAPINRALAEIGRDVKQLVTESVEDRAVDSVREEAAETRGRAVSRRDQFVLTWKTTAVLAVASAAPTALVVAFTK